MKIHFLSSVIAAGAMAWGSAAVADWPEKSIRLVVPYAAASATDIVARQIMPRLSAELGQSKPSRRR